MDIKRALLARWMATKALLTGRYPLQYYYWRMAPSSIRSKRTQASLFGHPFHFGELDDLTAQYLESVSYNQYHIENYTQGAIIDAGANVGMFSIFAARTYRMGSMYLKQ